MTEEKYKKEFLDIARSIIETPEFTAMKGYQHHIKGTLYGHSVKVAYLCFKYSKRRKLRISSEELVAAALLHDYYLYDLHGDGKRHPFHWFRHPRMALKNALERYPELTFTQRDMIVRHMFPLTLIPPVTRAGWLVCFYDKVAALSDRFGKNERIE